ncbi:MAG: hypothetical protein HYY76_15340 [Acidobacteria bacterium]|nr:hypothetical protein [Acidobacteriota bacterium]
MKKREKTSVNYRERQHRVNSKEHVWPVWLLAALGVDTQRTRIRSERGTRRPKTWSGFNLSLQVRHVCQRCNNRWMARLEARSRPFLRPLIAGTRSALNPAAQAAIATWAIKTAIVFEATRVEGDWFYSTDDCRFVREHARPSARTSVWLGNYVGNSVAFSHASDLTGSIGDDQAMAIHLTTLAFGRLVIQIANGKLPADVPLDTVVNVDMTPGPWNEAVVRVWPIVQETAAWPPTVALQDTGEASLDAFCDRWGGTEG